MNDANLPPLAVWPQRSQMSPPSLQTNAMQRNAKNYENLHYIICASVVTLVMRIQVSL
jgi:hypothetical protein